MFLKRQTEGSVICTSCGVLVGVTDDRCYNCGRRNPGLWGYGPALRRFGQDLGFVPFVMGATVTLYALSLLLVAQQRAGDDGSRALRSSFSLAPAAPSPVFGYGRWWTFLTAGWLHAGVLHVLFNVLWIRQLGPAVAELYGPARMVIIYVLSGAVGFMVTSLAGPVPVVDAVALCCATRA